MSDEDLRVGVVGLGKMGLVHTGVLNTLPGVEVAGLCEKSGLLRRFLGKVFEGVPVVRDVEEFSGLDLDAVFVTSPIPSHFSVVEAVCSERIARNLFVEKTLARTGEEAERLCELVEGLGGADMVGYLRRFAVTFRKAKSLLDEGVVGRVSYVRGYALSSDFLDAEGSEGGSGRGGVLRDLGCHVVDLALWFFGDLRVESAEVTSSNGDSLCFKAGHDDYLSVEFDVSWCREGYRMAEVGFSIRGSRGSLDVNDDSVMLDVGDSSVWHRHDLRDNVPFWLGLPEYYREDLHFVRSVLKGKVASPSFLDAYKVDRIIEDVEKKVDEN